VKIVYWQKWIDLRETRTKMITGSSYTYRRIHFTSGTALCLSSYLSVIIRGGRLSIRPSGRAPACYFG